MVKSFLKGIGAKPEQVKAVDILFETKWARPRFADTHDLDQMKLDGGRVVRVEGLRDGKRITILIQAEDASLMTKELEGFLKGGA